MGEPVEQRRLGPCRLQSHRGVLETALRVIVDGVARSQQQGLALVEDPAPLERVGQPIHRPVGEVLRQRDRPGTRRPSPTGWGPASPRSRARSRSSTDRRELLGGVDVADSGVEQFHAGLGDLHQLGEAGPPVTVATPRCCRRTHRPGTGGACTHRSLSVRGSALRSAESWAPRVAMT